jgi:serine/threonine protein kinase
MVFQPSTFFGFEPSPDWPAGAPGDSLTGLDGNVLAAIAGYGLQHRIGAGRRSSVWLARHLESGAEVALKLADGAGAGRGYGQEYALAALLAHPHVVRVLEHGCAGGVAFLAMEFAAGGALSAHLGRAHVPAAALRLLRKAAEALAGVQARALVHRGVKPANFLLRADGTLALADFGLLAAAGTREPRRPGALYGTPRYVAPEQLQGGAAQPAADVYSLGVLLHELLCGRPPFAGETLMEVLSQHLVAAAPPLPASLAALQPLADAMLAKDVAHRLPDAAAVVDRVKALQGAPSLHPAPAGLTGKRWTT